MKAIHLALPALLALIAACGNALVTVGQKKATAFANPFLFGAFSLLLAALCLFAVASMHSTTGWRAYIGSNAKWMAASAAGLVLLNVFLYLLYRSSGAGAYTLYALLAMGTTSVFVAMKVFGERITVFHWVSLLLAAAAIVSHLMGSLSSRG